MTSIIRGVALLLFLAISAKAVQAQGYKITGSVPIGGTGHWDCLIVDPDHRRLYVSNNSDVVVINAYSQQIVDKIPVDGFPHGIAIHNEHHLGFTTDGDSKTSDVKSPEQVGTFDLENLKRTATAKVGDDPDAIIYDAPSARVFAFNGDPRHATAAKTSKVEKAIDLGSNPEFAACDGRGNVYENIKNKSEIARVDSKSLDVTAHWPLAPCEKPTGLALDRANHRPFSVCSNGKIAVAEADTGKVVAALPIGALPDGAAYDPGSKLAFSSTVIRQSTKDEYSVVQTVNTEVGARTVALDTKTRKVYLSSAEFAPKPAGSNYPSVVPGSFKVLVLQQSSN